MRIEYPSGKDYPKIARTDIVYYTTFHYTCHTRLPHAFDTFFTENLDKLLR